MGTILYHGSEYLIENPQFGKGSLHNDYGRGFYCTENIELAKEWILHILSIPSTNYGIIITKKPTSNDSGN